MSNPLTIVQDENTLLRAKLLHVEEAWSYAGRNGNLVFGAMQNGQAAPHQVVWDSKKNSFQCTCPFVQRPCLHLAVLFMDYESGKFEDEVAVPIWLKETESVLPNHSKAMQQKIEQADKNEANRLKNKEERLEKARVGLLELETWLMDLVRRGIAPTLSESPEWNEAFAARVADASMTSLSRRIRQFGQQEDLERLPAALGAFWLAKRAFEKGTALEDGLFNDLLNFLGAQTLRKKDILQEVVGVEDDWVVLGNRLHQVEGALEERSTWFYGVKQKKYAELREFRYGSSPFEFSIPTGKVVQTKLYFYPSNYPQRVLLDEQQVVKERTIELVPKLGNFTLLRKSFAKAVNKNPWIQHIPAHLSAVLPCVDEKWQFYIKDQEGMVLPLAQDTALNWGLMALSGGQEIDLFGEWDGLRFLVVSEDI